MELGSIELAARLGVDERARELGDVASQTQCFVCSRSGVANHLSTKRGNDRA